MTAADFVPPGPVSLDDLRAAATAAQALLGRTFKVTQQRGVIVEWDREPLAMATVHPSSILRAPDDEARHREYEAFVADLKVAGGVCHSQ